jgi:DNA polymerase-1
MEATGVLVDTEHLKGLAKEFNRRLVTIEDTAYAEIGTPVNLGSPKQLAHLFFEKLGYPVIKKTKTGYSTDQEVLEILAKTYELPRIILEHRLLAKLKSTYVDALPKMRNPETGRVHTSFNQTGTATGRLSSSDPNLQNIPIRSEDGRRIRAAFIAPEGCEIISADYSQVELRIMAHLSEDEHFVEAFRNNEDIHRRTATEILTGGAEPDGEMRRRAKAINFGILYGLSEFGLSRQLGIPRAEAHAYIAAYFGRYPRIRHFLDASIEQGRREGYVSTITGRRRYLPNLRSKNGTVRQAAEHIAMNTPIQGSAADLIKLAMLRVRAALKQHRLRARLLLQVHDELVLEAPREERDAITELLQREMSGVLPLRVPVLVEVGHGPNWAEAH